MARKHIKGESRLRNAVKWGYGVFHKEKGSPFISNDMIAFYDTAKEAKAHAKELLDDLKLNRSKDYYNGEGYEVRKTFKTVNGKRSNPGDISEATSVSEGFHGRPAEYVEEIIEREKYRSQLAHLGDLEEFEIIHRDNRSVIPIAFIEHDQKGHVSVASTKDRRQLLLSGGDQSLELDPFELSNEERYKDYVFVGPIYSITYWTDKHHLEGPKYQQKGTQYIHQFGEEGGERPMLIYDRLNKRMFLAGGTYEVRDEGIYN